MLFRSVLDPITPNIGLHAQSMGNPLADYVESLERVRDLPCERVLPAHGEPFTGLQRRVNELLAHHDERAAEMLRLLGEHGPLSAYALASHMAWGRRGTGWQEMPMFQRRMAVTEVLAHLELLHGRRQLHKIIRDNTVAYGAIP